MGGPQFDRGNMVVTCHFDICKWEMRGDWSLVTGSELSADTYCANSHQLANAGRFCKGNKSLRRRPPSVCCHGILSGMIYRVGVTRIESNRNRHFGLKIESKSIENRNLEIVTSLALFIFYKT